VEEKRFACLGRQQQSQGQALGGGNNRLESGRRSHGVTLNFKINNYILMLIGRKGENDYF
jgi:hypothetical protein